MPHLKLALLPFLVCEVRCSLELVLFFLLSLRFYNRSLHKYSFEPSIIISELCKVGLGGSEQTFSAWLPHENYVQLDLMDVAHVS